jgi:hypothetical protein
MGKKRFNPFLRMRLAGVAQAAHAHGGVTRRDDVAVQATPRYWKNEFK